MKIRATATALVAAMVVTGGCQSAFQRAAVPALLSGTSTAMTAELSAAASELLDGKTVALGRTAFVNNHTLTLGSAMRNTPLGRLATGRVVTEPDALRLLRAGRRCRLEHINSGKQIELALTDCIAAPRAAND